jgi:hypothetical protein
MRLIAVTDGDSSMDIVELTGEKRRVCTRSLEFLRDAVVLYWERLPTVMVNADRQTWRATCDLRTYASDQEYNPEEDVDVNHMVRVHHRASISKTGYPFSPSSFSHHA